MRREEGHEVYAVRLWDLASGTEVRAPEDWLSLSLPGWKDKELTSVTFIELPGQLLVAGAGRAPGVPIWDVATFEEELTVSAPTQTAITSLVACEADAGEVLVAGSHDGGVFAWTIPDGEPQITLPDAHDGPVAVGRADWGGTNAVLTGGRDGILRVWSTRSWRCELTIPLREFIQAIAPASNGDVLVATLRGLVSLTPGGPLDG